MKPRTHLVRCCGDAKVDLADDLWSACFRGLACVNRCCQVEVLCYCCSPAWGALDLSCIILARNHGDKHYQGYQKTQHACELTCWKWQCQAQLCTAEVLSCKDGLTAGTP